MANWQNLKDDIAEVIRTNGNEEITGEVLQYILLEMVSRMGADFGIMGVCTPATQPVEPDGRIVYIGGAGEYRNFEGVDVDVPEGSIVLFMWTGSWTAKVIAVTRPVDAEITEGGTNPVEGGAVYQAFAELKAAGYLFAGVAIPSTVPPTSPTVKLFYLAAQSGIYSEFGSGITVDAGLTVIRYDGSIWRKDVLWVVSDAVEAGSGNILTSGGAAAALADKVDKEPGKGLSENDYTNDEKAKLFNLPTEQALTEMLGLKQDVLTFDNMPTQGSNNPVKSGGIYEAIKDFITASTTNLVNYYLKAETYTKDEVLALIAAIKQFRYEVVDQLPEASADTMGIFYFVPSEEPGQDNVKDEYITLSRTEGSTTAYYWEKIGTTEIDLSNYPTFAQMTAAINAGLEDYYTKAEVAEVIAQAVAAALASYYTKSEVDAKKDEAYGDLAQLSLKADKEVIAVGEGTAVMLSFAVNVAATSISLKRSGVEIATGTGKTLTFLDNVTPAAAGSVAYVAECVIGGVTRTAEVTVEAVDAVYYGAGQDETDIVTKASARKTPAGRYLVTVASDGDYIMVLVPYAMAVEFVTMGGLELPMDAPTGVVVDGKSYKCYKSANVYQAGTYQINVY